MKEKEIVNCTISELINMCIGQDCYQCEILESCNTLKSLGLIDIPTLTDLPSVVLEKINIKDQ